MDTPPTASRSTQSRSGVTPRGAPTTTGRARLKEVLKEPDAKRLFGAQFLAQAADGLAQAAFATVLILDPVNAGTPERIFVLFAVTLLPYSAISPFLGVFVDRWRRRELMSWANLLRAMVLLTYPLWERAISGDAGLYVGVILLLGFGRLFLTTKGALLPVVVHELDLLRANAFSSGGGMISALMGGVAGVVLIDKIPATGVFFCAGVVYLASALVVRRLSEPFAHPEPPEDAVTTAVARMARGLAEGLRAIWARPKARLPLIGIFILRCVGMFVAIGAILIIKEVYPAPEDDSIRATVSALALGSAGAGAFIGALTAPFWGARLARAGLIVLGFCISGIGIVAVGGISNIPAVLAVTFMGGYGGFLAKVSVDASVQSALPDDYRGRAFALYDILYNLASVAAAVVMLTATQGALRGPMLIAGALTFAMAAALGGAMRGAEMPLLKDRSGSEG